jgi:hypothetical protein
MGERAECVMLNKGRLYCYRRAPSRRHFAPHAIASGKEALHAAQAQRATAFHAGAPSA